MTRLNKILAGVGAVSVALLLTGFFVPGGLTQIFVGLPGGTTNISGQLIVEDAAGSPPTCATSTTAGELCVEGDIESNGNMDIAGTATLTGAVTFGAGATLGGNLTLENAEIIANGTDDLICLTGGGGTSDENICFDVDGTNTVGLSSTTGATELDFQAVNIALNDNTDIILGTGNDALISYDATTADPDSLIIGVGADSRQVHIMEAADIATDLTIAQQTNPTLMVHSADAATATDYVSVAHDQTDGVISTGGGNLNLTPAGATVAVTGAVTITTDLTSSDTGDIGWTIQSGANTACNTTCTSACVFGWDTSGTQADIVGCADAGADECLCAGSS